MNKKDYYLQTWPFNFGAIKNQDFKKSKVVIVPVPYDITTSWRGGTREGPRAIINASRQLDELFFDEGNPFPIFTFDESELSCGPGREAIDGLKEVVGDILSKDKFPFLLGGEHSITLGGVEALKEKHSNLSVLQLDAHLDLLDEYCGSRYTHACVMRRIQDLKIPTVQVGIRSIDPETEDYMKSGKIKNIFQAPKIPVEKVLENLTEDVYLTVDLDVFDSGIMPSVGTPVPGGLGWYEVLDLIEKVAKKKNIVGADVVELCPIPGMVAPDFLAAKLVYKIISYTLK
ncbi:MAG: agmatinase [Parcubacteria group bacterium]|mgnify:CR=1 FL=1|nr:agmatinase [Parcubacteria group bacterium]|tara:strand:- start:3563 stop:4423 length:861 start_codon:yes stop_codon:yes gene_type:complete